MGEVEFDLDAVGPKTGPSQAEHDPQPGLSAVKRSPATGTSAVDEAGGV